MVHGGTIVEVGGVRNEVILRRLEMYVVKKFKQCKSKNWQSCRYQGVILLKLVYQQF